MNKRNVPVLNRLYIYIVGSTFQNKTKLLQSQTSLDYDT